MRIGIWLDDLGLGLRGGLSRVPPWGMDVLGLDGLGMELFQGLSGTGQRDLMQRVRAAGCNLAALRGDVGGRRLSDPSTLDQCLSRVQKVFELARGLGAPFVVVPLGHIPPSNESASTRTALRDAVKALSAWGASTGVRPVVPAGSEAPEELAAFLNEHDSAGFLGLDLNPGGVLGRGSNPTAALHQMSSRLVMATAADFYRGGGEAPFGKGDVPWGEVLIGLSLAPGQDPPPMLAACARECDRVAALQSSVAALKKLRLNPMG